MLRIGKPIFITPTRLLPNGAYRDGLDRRDKKNYLEKKILIAPIKPTTHHKRFCVVMGLIGTIKLKKIVFSHRAS